MDRSRHLHSSLLALVASLFATVAAIDYPATGDISLVFPRNETYEVVAPFPVIFGFQNAPVLLGYSAFFRWSLDCDDGTLFGLGDHDSGMDPTLPQETYFYVNGSKGCAGCEPDDAFPYFRHEQDSCTLEWEFSYVTTCHKNDDGSTTIKSGYGKQEGTVGFTLKPGATTPHDAIKNYKGCPIGLAAKEVVANLTGCPDEGGKAKPNPCDLDVKAAAPSLLKEMVEPTSTYKGASSTPTSTGGSSSDDDEDGGSSDSDSDSDSGSDSDSDSGNGDDAGSGSGSGNGDDSDDNDDAAVALVSSIWTIVPVTVFSIAVLYAL